MVRAARGDDGAGSGAGSGSDANLAAQVAELRAQVAELRANVDMVTASTVEATSKESPFHLYGFIDMGLQKVWTSDPAAVETTASTFVLGNINLYLDFHPVPDWSSLVEARLTNYPGGEDALVRDPGNSIGDDTVQWGGIVLERAYIQWQHHADLGVRVGEFLTPYGIWNVDHGTPTLLSLYRPEFVSLQLWPEHQVGVELFGEKRGLLPGRWVLEYHAYVANGRTTGAVDLTDGKTVGARVVARETHVAFGVSALIGDNTSTMDEAPANSSQVGIAPGGREAGVGADASIDLGALRLRAEGITRHVAGVVGMAPQWQGDVYALAAYRVPGTRFEPVVYVEGLHLPQLDGDTQVATALGVNVYFTPATQLKMQASRAATFEDADLSRGSRTHETFLAAKLVMAF